MTTECNCNNGAEILFGHADTCRLWDTLLNQEAIDTMPDDVVNQVQAILNKIK